MSKRAFFLVIITLSFLTGIYAQPELDISFNATGKVMTDLGPGDDTIYDLMIQADGRIVAVGTKNASGSPRFFALTRYYSNGSLDTTFGDNGQVLTDFDANAVNEGALAAAMQPDGKVIAAGYVSLSSPGPGFFALARYNTNGSLDPTFGDGGKVLTAIAHHLNEARAIAIGQDGKIVVTGYYFSPSSNFQTLVARYNADGSPDTTFGPGGTVTDTRGSVFGSTNLAEAVAIQPDGKIVIAGYFRADPDAVSVATITRFNVNGAYDNSFGTAGRLDIPNASTPTTFNDIEILPDGRIMAAGRSTPNFFLMRFDANGSADTTFDGDGRVTTPMGGTSALATSLLVRPNGKIFVSGIVNGQSFAAAAYNSDGSLDTSFSGNGKLTFGFGGSSSMAFGMTTDGLGRIVLGGTGNNMFALARLYTLEPTLVTVTGRTLLENGQPIKGINIALTNQAGETLYAFTSPFGYFQFQVPTGQAYTLSVSSKRYTFETRVFGVNEAIDNLSLIGTPIEPRPSGYSLNERKNMFVGRVSAPMSMRRRTGAFKSIY